MFDKTLSNLKGPGIKPGIPGSKDSRIGKMPVPVRTGQLRRSLKMVPISTLQAAIFCDPHISNYAKYVHDGAKGVPPRRFLGDVVRTNEKRYINMIKSKIFQELSKINNYGY